MAASRTIAVLSAALLLALAVVPTVFAVSSLQSAAPTPISATQGSIGPNTGKAPVYVHFKPRDVSGVQGGTVTVHATVKNKGSFDYVATSCTLWYRLGTSGAWTKAGVCLNPSDFPVTFAAGSTAHFSTSQKVSDTFPTGTYEWKIELHGTYNGVAMNSHLGKLIVTIT